MGVFRNGQDDAIGLLRRSWVVMVIVAVMCAIGVFVSLGTSDRMRGRGKELLEKMVHPMRRGGGEKKTKGGRHAQA